MIIGIGAIAIDNELHNSDEYFGVLTSQPISCAQRGRLTVNYFAGPKSQLIICAAQNCVAQPKFDNSNQISVTLNSPKEFKIRIFATRKFDDKNNEEYLDLSSFVIIKKITAIGGFCRLETPAERTCKALTCTFGGKKLLIFYFCI